MGESSFTYWTTTDTPSLTGYAIVIFVLLVCWLWDKAFH